VLDERRTTRKPKKENRKRYPKICEFLINNESNMQKIEKKSGNIHTIMANHVGGASRKAERSSDFHTGESINSLSQKSDCTPSVKALLYLILEKRKLLFQLAEVLHGQAL